MRISDDLFADPPEFCPDREGLDFSGAGLAVVSANFGEAAIATAMAKRAGGEDPVNREPINKEVVLKLAVRDDLDGGVDLATAAHMVQQQVETWQSKGGWLGRDFAIGKFAGPVACQVKKASLADFGGWQAGDSPDVTLSLLTSAGWYLSEEIEVDLGSESTERELIADIEDLRGSSSGLLRLEVTNEGDDPWRGVIAAIECEDHPQDETAETTAALAYACGDLTPVGDAKVVEIGSDKGVEHDSLTAGYLVVLSSEIDGVGHMTHRGPRQPHFRVHNPGGDTLQLLLEWRVLGSLGWIPNKPVTVGATTDYIDVDCHECRPERAVRGDERWEFRVKARALDGNGKVVFHKVRLEPTEQRIVVRSPESQASADQQSSKSPGKVTTTAGVGSVAWTNAENAKAADGSYATCELPEPGDYSKYLGANKFLFDLPEDATVLGIIAAIKRFKDPGPVLAESAVRLVKAGVLVPTNRAIVANLPEVNTLVHRGAADDLWDETWTAADINDELTGFAYAVQGYGTAKVDWMGMGVYFTEAEDENRVCFAGRKIELASDGVFRQHPTDDVWARVVPDEGSFYLRAPVPGLEQRKARVMVVPSQGDFASLEDAGKPKLKARGFLRPGFILSPESADEVGS